MINITGTLGSFNLDNILIPFTETPLENSVDVTTLDFTQYTDFVNNKREWNISWAKLDEQDYQDLKDIYDLQFSLNEYPILTIPYYGIEVPVRMRINEKDIRKDGCYMMGVKINLTEQYATGYSPNYLLLENDELLFVDVNNYLLL